MPALSDTAIREMVRTNRLGIEPFDPNHVQPASYDLTLLGPPEGEITLYPIHYYVDQMFDYIAETIQALNSGPNYNVEDRIQMVHKELKKKNSFQLLSTREVITLPDNIKADVHGRSSLARKGLFIHISAGFIDPGFSGQITLECINVAGEPITLLPGDRVAQICFYTLDNNATIPYNGRYQNQRGPTESKFQHGDN